MNSYEILFSDVSGSNKEPQLVTRKFNASSIVFDKLGVWAVGIWVGSKELEHIFFPIGRIKYIRKIEHEN